MRVVLGVALLIESGYCLQQANASAAVLGIGLIGVLAGGLLLVGFLTPIAASVVGLGALAIRVSLLPACTPTLFDGKAPTLFAFTILLAVGALGPGAFSVDARLFGRREIIIPPPVSRT